MAGLQGVEVELQPIIDRVHDGHGLHGGVARGGQLPAGHADQLNGQQLEDGLRQLLPDAAPCPAAEGDVVEAACSLWPAGTEAVRVKAAGGGLVDSSCLMCVTDAVHDAPAFGDLVALGRGEKREERTVTYLCCWRVSRGCLGTAPLHCPPALQFLFSPAQLGPTKVAG